MDPASFSFANSGDAAIIRPSNSLWVRLRRRFPVPLLVFLP